MILGRTEPRITNDVLRLKELLGMSLVTLEGVRGMAQLEADNGSVAWKNSLNMIDAMIFEIRSGK